MLSAPPTLAGILFSILVPLALILVVGALVRRRSDVLPQRAVRLLEHRAAPVAAGFLTAMVVLYVWGSLNEPGVINDEQAYLLQADLFAQGRWTAPPPPLPEFFEQAHVFIDPAVAAKYPPATSFAMVPGMWLGLPGLVPILLSALSGGLVFALARRYTPAIVAAMAWLLWTTSAIKLAVSASYLSQHLSLALWLVALWFLARWHESRRSIDIAVVAAAVTGMWLTRPLTAIGLGLPIAAFAAFRLLRQRSWRQAALAVVVAVPLLAATLVWQAKTLGDWSISPYAEYSRQYFPFVKPGFGVDPTPPARQPPADIQWLADAFRDLHAAHQPDALPAILVERVVVTLMTLGRSWRGFLIVAFLAAAVQATGALRFGLVSAVMLMLAYLIYAHAAPWVIYYTEVFPVFFVLAAAGIARIAATTMRLHRDASLAAAATITVLLIPAAAWDIQQAKAERDEWSRFHRTARRVLESLPDGKSVVFVRYPDDHAHHWQLVETPVNGEAAARWVVRDLGPEKNAELLALTDRAAYRLHVSDWTLERIR